MNKNLKSRLKKELDYFRKTPGKIYDELKEKFEGGNKMGLWKTMVTTVAVGGIFYGGMLYERSINDEQIDILQTQVENRASVDYKVLSLMVDMVEQPRVVEKTFQDYESLLNNPVKLQTQLKKYEIKIE